jgi:hypothetical protein
MFIQIIQGRVADPEALQSQIDLWGNQLAPGAEGWLGTTYGTTDDGTFVAVVRFESEEAARANSDRPEQGEWWDTTRAAFDGAPTFHESSDVDLLLGGGSDDAGFVQVLQGRTGDVARLRALEQQGESLMASNRPDIIGATIVIEPDGTFTETVSFTSEDEARAGESAEMPADVRQLIDEESSLMQDVRYMDLHQPHFMSRR